MPSHGRLFALIKDICFGARNGRPWLGINFMIRENVSLENFSTFKVGGNADFFLEAETIEQISGGVGFADKKDIPIFVLGGGSNILISDQGFRGLVLKFQDKSFVYNDLGDKVEVIAGAGASWDGLVKETVDRGLFGLENLSGIPGTVGAAPVQNIGAYGSEVKDFLSWVEVFDLETGEVRRINTDDCQLSYRESLFRKGGRHLLITRVSFLLNLSGRVNLSYKDLNNYFAGRNVGPAEVRQAVLEIRGKKFPDLSKFGTAGSFFKNPIISQESFWALKDRYPELPGFEVLSSSGKQVKIPLAWVLDKILNLNGKKFGRVGFFRNQPLVVVNLGGASAGEIKDVTDNIILQVKEKVGINLEREITLIGEF